MNGPDRHGGSGKSTERAERVLARCRELALCTEVEGETTRLFLAPSMHRVHALVGGWMRAAGMSVNVDAAGNLLGLLPGSDADGPRLLLEQVKMVAGTRSQCHYGSLSSMVVISGLTPAAA